MKPLSQHIHESFQHANETQETIIENLNDETSTEEVVTPTEEVEQSTENETTVEE